MGELIVMKKKLSFFVSAVMFLTVLLSMAPISMALPEPFDNIGFDYKNELIIGLDPSIQYQYVMSGEGIYRDITDGSTSFSISDDITRFQNNGYQQATMKINVKGSSSVFHQLNYTGTSQLHRHSMA